MAITLDDLTVNFNGFDDFIDLAIGMKLGIDEAKREALEEIFPGTETKKGGKQLSHDHTWPSRSHPWWRRARRTRSPWSRSR